MPFLPPNQQRRSIEGKKIITVIKETCVWLPPWLDE